MVLLAPKTGAVLVLLLGVFLLAVQGRVRRCYVCRSRGELGDCKDPFHFNATNVEEVKGVEASPCASGWCAKIVEGENSDFDTATERMCVVRPPTDGEKRCSDTIIDGKPVYMCFCQGDLCNRAQHPELTMAPLLVMALIPLLANINRRRV